MIFIPIVTILIFLFIFNRNKKYEWNVTNVLALTYLTSFSLGAIIEYTLPFYRIYDTQAEPMIYLSFAVFLVLVPYMRLHEGKIKYIVINNVKAYRLLESILVYSAILTTPYFLYIAMTSLSGELGANRILGQSSVMRTFGLFNSIMSFLPNFYPVFIFYFFVNLSLPVSKKRKQRLILSFLASLSYIIYVLAFVGRDGFVLWIMTFLIMSVFFKNFYSIYSRKQIKKIFIIVAILGLIPFVLITISRFSSRIESELVWVIYYGGQSSIAFNDSYIADFPINYGSGSFPLFFNWARSLGFVNYNPNTAVTSQELFLSSGVQLWTFGTFIKSFLFNFGKVGTIIFLLIMSITNFKLIKKAMRKKQFEFSDFLIFLLLLQIIYHGVFYFRLYSVNLYIVAIFLISIYFKVSTSVGKPIVIKNRLNISSNKSL